MQASQWKGNPLQICYPGFIIPFELSALPLLLLLADLMHSGGEVTRLLHMYVIG